ncbi:MAG: metal ABC transporter ATP-binding protein [Phycisphaerales bacterium]|nr:metal ABC transporter ATP-binding protein [Phycisphaerales bacterium]
MPSSDSAPPTATPAVQVDGVTFTYPGGDAPALEGVSLTVAEGSRLGVLGPNGGGKSTLLKLVLGVLTPDAGRITVLGRSPGAAARAGLIGYVPQGLEVEKGFPLSVRRVVELAVSWRLAPWRRLPVAERQRVESLLGLVGAGGFAERPIGSLSGGQLQRVMIARALAPRPRVLVLDEPAVGIDAAGQAQFAELLEGVHRQTGVTLLMVSHDIRAIAAGCDRVACLSRRLHFHDAPSGLTPAVLAEVFAHDVAGLAGIGPLAGMHVHEHGAGETCPLDGGAPVRPTVCAKRPGGGA